MDVETQPVDVTLPDGTLVQGTFHIWEIAPEDSQNVRLGLSMLDNRIEKIEYDYFTAMQHIRLELEAEGIRLCCYGASKNVYPSPMSIDMGRGKKAYKLTMGQHAKTSDLVSIFDNGPDVEPATVDEQKAFREAWGASLG